MRFSLGGVLSGNTLDWSFSPLPWNLSLTHGALAAVMSTLALHTSEEAKSSAS